jgi:hypothetical protein
MCIALVILYIHKQCCSYIISKLFHTNKIVVIITSLIVYKEKKIVKKHSLCARIYIYNKMILFLTLILKKHKKLSTFYKCMKIKKKKNDVIHFAYKYYWS